MLNKEKYKDELEQILVNGNVLAIDKKHNKIISCCDCSRCKFSTDVGCTEKRREWLNSEYVDPEVDWSKIPVDTPILVRDSEDEKQSRDNAWHNLKDQKPEDGQEVLTLDGLGVQEDRWSDDADYFESTDAKEIWWRKMPEPPEV